MGPETILTNEEEAALAKYCSNMAKLGFPLHSEDIKGSIQAVLKKCPRQNPFKDDRPGRKWLKNFLKRHPNVDKLNTEAISMARALVSKESIMYWFSQLRQYFADSQSQSLAIVWTFLTTTDEFLIVMRLGAKPALIRIRFQAQRFQEPIRNKTGQ